VIDAKCLVACWQSKGHNSTAIHEKLITQFYEKALICLLVAGGLRHFHFGEDIFEPRIHTGKPWDGLIDFKVLTELTISPFRNMRTLDVTLDIPRPTIWDQLQDGPFVVKHLWWVLHALNTISKTVEGLSCDLVMSPQQLMLHMDNSTPGRARESITCLKRFRIGPIDYSRAPRT
jgi:hypothetical protein